MSQKAAENNKAKVIKVSKAFEPAAERPRIALGSMSQLFVLLGGLILTACLYLILTFFVQKSLAEEQRFVARDAQKTVADRLASPAKSIEILSAVLSFIPDDQRALITGEDKRLAALASVFDRIFFLFKDPVGSWYIRDITPSIPGVENISPIATGSESALKEQIVSTVGTKPSETAIITDIPGAFYTAEQTDPLVKAKPYAYAKPIFSGQMERGIVTGIVRASSLIGNDWIEGKSGLDGLFIRDAQNSQHIYVMSRSLSEKKADQLVKEGNDKISYSNNGRWQIAALAGHDPQSFIFANSPLVVLFFGLFITGLMTLYVRNTQKSSYRLVNADKNLNLKIQALNNEIAEKERLGGLLNQSKSEFEAIATMLDDVIFEIDADGRVSYMSQALSTLAGVDPKNILQKDMTGLFLPADQKTFRDFLRHLKDRKSLLCRFDIKIRTTQGGVRAVEIQMSLIESKSSESVPVIIGRIKDIETHAKAERALAEAEARYRDIVENAANGIYQITTDGQFVSINPAMAKMLGYSSPAQMMGEVKNAHKVLYENARERSRFIREVTENGEVRNYETQMLTRSGTHIWVNENAHARYDDKGIVLYVEGNIEDITKRKEVEGQLRDAKIKSDMASRAKSEFLANMSHELRTPLNAIIGFAEIIKKEVLGPVNNQQYKEYAADIYESGRKLMTIINEILDISKIEAGQRQLNESEVNLAALSASCVDFLSSRAQEGKLSILNHIDERVPRLKGEELAIKQILLNLLSNAVKYTPEGGQITLSYELDADSHLRVSVTDTGIGLDESEIEKALSAFGQVESALSRSSSGVGLGLTLVDLLTRLHGGRLELFSQKGVGTTVTIIFPSSRVLSRPHGRGEETTHSAGTAKTLQ